MANYQTSIAAIRVVIFALAGTSIVLPAVSYSQSAESPLSPPTSDQAVISPPPIATNLLLPYQLSDAEKAMLKNAVSTPNRIDKHRDSFRHPYETIDFFGLKANSKVLEIWPGQGWYSTIITDYLKQGGGEFIAAQFDTSTTNSNLVKEVVENYSRHFAGNQGQFGRVSVVPFGPRSKELGAKDSVDAILTFRNIHNWLNQGWAEKAFDDFFKVLKPGGILGIEEHRAAEDSPQDPLAADGYVRQDYVIDLAKEAGFVFIKASEINANPKDLKDHPFGVWTLPPVGRTAPAGKPANPNFDQSKYKEIGESDRMTLLFMKPFPPPAKMAKAKEKPPKSNPLAVIFGQKPKPAPNVETVDPLIDKKPDAPEEKVQIVFEPVKVAFTPPPKEKPPILPPIENTKPIEEPKGEPIDFSKENSKSDLPSFTIPTWGEKTKPDQPIKPVQKTTSKSSKPKPKTPSTQVLTKEKPTEKKIETKTSKASAPPPKTKTIAVEKKENVAKPSNVKKPVSKPSEPAKKTSASAKTNIAAKTNTKAKTPAPAKPAAKKPESAKPAATKKDPNIPDWNVKSKKKK